MDSDGTKAGFDNELNSRIADVVDIPIIASGGAGTMEHIKDAFIEGRAMQPLEVLSFILER